MKSTTSFLYFKLTAILYICLFVISCSSDDTATTPEDENTCGLLSTELTGTLMDQTFTLMGVTASYFETDDEYQLFFYGDDEIGADDPCDIFAQQGISITFFVNNTVEDGSGISTIYNASNMEFSNPTACYSIESITATMITGKMAIKDDENGTNVNGSWSALICD